MKVPRITFSVKKKNRKNWKSNNCPIFGSEHLIKQPSQRSLWIQPFLRETSSIKQKKKKFLFWLQFVSQIQFLFYSNHVKKSPTVVIARNLLYFFVIEELFQNPNKQKTFFCKVSPTYNFKSNISNKSKNEMDSRWNGSFKELVTDWHNKALREILESWSNSNNELLSSGDQKFAVIAITCIKFCPRIWQFTIKVSCFTALFYNFYFIILFKHLFKNSKKNNL